MAASKRWIFNQGEVMDKMELIKDNLAKIDKAIGVALYAGNDNALQGLIAQRRWFVLDVCSQMDCEVAQGGPQYECGDKVTMAEINYQRTLNAAIEKAREKSMVRREELPAVIFGKHLGSCALTPCQNDSSTMVGSVWCRIACQHFAGNKGYAVYCWYPEKRRQ
jgi:hypothetical protein